MLVASCCFTAIKSINLSLSQHHRTCHSACLADTIWLGVMTDSVNGMVFDWVGWVLGSDHLEKGKKWDRLCMAHNCVFVCLCICIRVFG